ncbi:MAG: redoxin domain-containing protein [Gammaproteobacteria bacterium]|jgi:thiol-disulfide isomerase/thioredoxin
MRNGLILLLAAVLTLAFVGSKISAATALNAPAPDISAERWINSKPLNWDTLKGKVVIVEFWTFGCHNCRNVEPYVKSWYQKYRTKGLEVVAVHSPEFDHERNFDNVRDYVKEHAITYPVAIDNDFTIWRRFANRYWPAMYIVDKTGVIRYRFIGEGRYNKIENVLQTLLADKVSDSGQVVGLR